MLKENCPIFMISSFQILTIYAIFSLCKLSVVQASIRSQTSWPTYPTEKCSSDTKLKYLSGNALTDSLNCLGPNDSPYPR